MYAFACVCGVFPGVQLAKHYERSLLDLNTGRNFETSVLLANTNAIALNRRYQGLAGSLVLATIPRNS